MKLLQLRPRGRKETSRGCGIAEGELKNGNEKKKGSLFLYLHLTTAVFRSCTELGHAYQADGNIQ
jgi:hypothetical protein